MAAGAGIERVCVGYIDENSYILTEGSACVLVDPGDEAAKILALLDERRLRPTLIVATHGHLDHTGAIPAILQAFGGGPESASGISVAPPVAVHAADLPYFGPGSEATNRALFRAIRASAYFTHFWRPMPTPDLLLAEGDILPGTSWRVVHTPGHSAGSICLHHAGSGALISGDTLFQGGVGRTDAPDSDPGALARSLLRLAGLNPDTIVYPGHGGTTTIGAEAAAGTFGR